MARSDNRSEYLPLAVTAVLACSLATLVLWSRQSEQRNRDSDNTEDETVVELLAVEKAMPNGMTIPALTWFKGDYRKVEETLRQRAHEILKANPWLGGRLLKRNGELSLVYSASSTANPSFHFQCLTNLKKPISRDTPLVQLAPRLSHLIALKRGPTNPLWKVYIIPDFKRPHDHFAVVFVMSHVIADGNTFYRIQNMLLNAKEPVDALDEKRIMNMEEHQIEVMGGKAEYNILHSTGYIVNLVCGVFHRMFTRTKLVVRIHLVDPKGMEEAKKQAVAGRNDIAFVSSNDVITSWFLHNCRCKHGHMAINFRGRFEGCTENNAGNYMNVLFLRPDDSASAALIRKTILPKEPPLLQRQVTQTEPMPNFWTMAVESLAFATNWSSFAKPALIDGCEEDIQIPLYDYAGPFPSTFVMLCIFRAGSRGLAVIIIGTAEKLAGLEREVPFLCKEQLV
jgi:Wax ester synthase-like Acyl-CoA acyltransferase domain